MSMPKFSPIKNTLLYTKEELAEITGRHHLSIYREMKKNQAYFETENIQHARGAKTTHFYDPSIIQGFTRLAPTPTLPTLPASPVGGRGKDVVQRGAITINICRPSIFGSCSTLA